MSSPLISEIAYRLLRLEQQLESYQRLHAEELDEMRRILIELKHQVLEVSLEKRTEEKADSTNTVTGIQ